MASKSFRGFDKDAFLAKVTKAYMAIMGDGRGGVFCENSLSTDQRTGATKPTTPLSSAPSMS